MGKILHLRPTTRSLVVTQDGTDYRLAMRPALTELERSAVTSHASAREALRHGKQLSRMFPALFVEVVDETGAAA